MYLHKYSAASIMGEHMCMKYARGCISCLGLMNPLSRPGQRCRIGHVCGGGMDHEDPSPNPYWIWSGVGMANQYIAEQGYDPNWIWIWIYPVWDPMIHPILRWVD